MKFNAKAATATPHNGRGNGSVGYRLSSDELQSGLEIQTVSMTSLPPNLISELLRLRKTWGPIAAADGYMAG